MQAAVDGAVTTVENTRYEVAKKTSRLAGCLTFLFIGAILVPMVLFLMALLMGLMLMAIECDEAKRRHAGNAQLFYNGTEAVDIDGIDVDAMCSVYEWFKYVLGNMVALATPLTVVTPSSGHVLGEMLDLLIAAWSVTMAGVFYGIIGALAFTSVMVEATEGSLMRTWQRLLMKGAMGELVKHESGMDFAEFLSVAPSNYSEKQLRELFERADRDGSGAIDRTEVNALLASLEETPVETMPVRLHVRNPPGEGGELDGVVAMLSTLTEAVQRLEAKMVAFDARLEGKLPPLNAVVTPRGTVHSVID